MKVAERGPATRGAIVRVATRRGGWFVALVLGALSMACGGRGLSPTPPDPDPFDRETYVIGVTDSMRISVWKNPELSIGVVVRTDGMISVPLLDDVQAEGLEPMELKEVLTREFSEFVEAPDVTVIITGMNSKFVTVVGGAGRNTRIPITRHLRILEALATVGGFRAFADRTDVRVVRRQDDGSEVEYRFDYDAYLKGRAPGTNFYLKYGDVIIVPE